MRNYIDRAKQKSNSGRGLNWNGSNNRMGFVQQQRGMNATGDGSTARASSPYAVTVTSTSNAAVLNFDVLGAYQYINNAGFDAAGSLVIGSITISSAIPNVSYRELLYQSMNSPFSVGQTYINSTVAAQIIVPFSIVTKDASGSVVQVPTVPVTDPYQFQTNALVINSPYRIDGFTKLTFTQVLPNSATSIFWYPSDNVNTARTLSGQTAVKSYGDPGIIRR